MAFVNEYISEEEFKLSQTDEQFLAENPIYKVTPPGYRYWAIDRNRQITLWMSRTANQRDTDESWVEFTLNVAGIVFICRMERGPGRSVKFSESPFIISWNLTSITPQYSDHLTHEQVIEILKEGLTVFGYDGISYPIANTLVKCNF